MLFELAQIPLGLLYGNFLEWGIHKYILHGLGKNKKSIWNFHWHDHHKLSRKNEFIDPEYNESIFQFKAPLKEALSLFGLLIVHAPLFLITPVFAFTLLYCLFNYYYVHQRGHRDPLWAEKNIPWHIEHHMGKNQDANWCVTKPLFDIIFKTKTEYKNIKSL